MKKALLLFLCAALAFASLTMFTTAFDGNDYGSNGSSSSNGSSNWSNSNSSSGGDWGDIGAEAIIILVIFIVIAIIFSVVKSKHGGSAGGARPSSQQGLHIQLPDRTMQIEQIIKQNDPNFSTHDFLSFAKNVYIDIQNAWCKRDMTPVRPVLHDNLYSSTVRQLQSKIDQGVIFHYESIVVNTAYLTSYARDAQFEYATIYLNARMIDWQEDEKTGKILRGDKTTRWDMRYKMKFMRTAGVLTKEEVAKAQGHNCPNCGAPIEISSSGQCVYCNSVVTTGQYSWVLSDFGTIRNDTVDEGIRN